MRTGYQLQSGEGGTGGLHRRDAERTPRRRAAALFASAAVVATVAALGIAAAARADSVGEVVTVGQMAAQAQSEGEVAFTRQCAGCHGANGEGGVGQDLRLWTGSVEDTTAVIAQGTEGMPAFSTTLTTEQIEALARYVDELTGTSLYARECAVCHGTAGEGGAGPSLKLSDLGDADRRSVIENGFGSMPGFASDLTAIEIDALVGRTAGYRSVGPTLYTTQCTPCHGERGEGSTGPPLVPSPVGREEAVTVVGSGFGGMPAFEAISDPGDIEAIVAFVLSLDSLPTTTLPATTTTTQVVSAVDLFAGSCASCHGVDAEGGIGPSLVGADISTEELTEAITDGQGSMPGFSGVLRSQEIAALVEFIESLAEPSPTQATEAGADLFTQQCAACHGADGRGGLGPSLRTTLLEGNDLREAIAQGDATMPAFQRTLSSSEIELVAEFVEWLRQSAGSIVPLRGGSVIYGQDCSACHGDRGEGGIGPELQDSPLTVNEIIARVYGGHTAGMPAFAGALDGQQVRDVAHYIKTFESSGDSEPGFGMLQYVLLGSVGLVVLVGAVIGVLRVRRRRVAA